MTILLTREANVNHLFLAPKIFPEHHGPHWTLSEQHTFLTCRMSATMCDLLLLSSSITHRMCPGSHRMRRGFKETDLRCFREATSLPQPLFPTARVQSRHHAPSVLSDLRCPSALGCCLSSGRFSLASACLLSGVFYFCVAGDVSSVYLRRIFLLSVAYLRRIHYAHYVRSFVVRHKSCVPRVCAGSMPFIDRA